MGRQEKPGVIRRTVMLGRAELVPDPAQPDAWILFVDGTQQSHVNLAHPAILSFEYTRLIGHVIDVLEPGPLRTVHLGGGGLTLPRYLAATRPGSTNVVAEVDRELVDFVREHLPWPREQSIRVRAEDARTVLSTLPADSADLMILDVFAGARTPGPLTTIETFRRAAEVLRAPHGVLVANLADERPLVYARRFVAGIAAAFRRVAVLAEPAVLRGRRFGNLVAIGWRDDPSATTLAELIHRCAAEPYPARVLHGTDLRGFLGAYEPFVDGDAPGSPEPPAGIFG